MDTRQDGRHLLVSDLDGTLRRDQQFHAGDLRQLRALGRRGWVRCVATGRSLYSARQVLSESFPIDYLVFSSGAGLMRWPDGRLLESRVMDTETLSRVFTAMREMALDFMVHAPVPENHRFEYFQLGGGVKDFLRRLDRYADYATAGDPDAFELRTASQLLAVADCTVGPRIVDELRARLPDVTVVRTTSPLDGVSTWIEVFPKEVSKGQAVASLAAALGIARSRTVAVGNDYNDEDMLAWAGCGLLVDGAPAELRRKFPCLPGSGKGCVSAAVEHSRRLGGPTDKGRKGV